MFNVNLYLYSQGRSLPALLFPLVFLPSVGFLPPPTLYLYSTLISPLVFLQHGLCEAWNTETWQVSQIPKESSKAMRQGVELSGEELYLDYGLIRQGTEQHFANNWFCCWDCWSSIWGKNQRAGSWQSTSGKVLLAELGSGCRRCHRVECIRREGSGCQQW